MRLREYTPEDLPEIAELFYETVHAVNIRDYTKKQIEVWAGKEGRLKERGAFFETLYTIVAVHEDGRVIGYGNIDKTGYLDHLFVHKDFQRRGIATAICGQLEAHAKAGDIRTITVHASITAKKFFEHRGYRVYKEQCVKIEKESLTNFVMKKTFCEAV